MRVAIDVRVAQKIAGQYREEYEAAGSLGLYHWWAPCDNRPVSVQRDAYGVAIKHRQPADPTKFGWNLYGTAELGKEWAKYHYLLDFGDVVIPTHVAAWRDQDDENKLIVHPFPVNDGSIRPDNGREVDYWNWAVGPRKMFHLKLTELTFSE